MKIVHITLAGAYTEKMTYQEVLLSDENIKAGHDVIVIASCYCYENGKIIKVKPEDTILPNGKRLIRLRYCHYINDYISEKVRRAKSLYKILSQIKPDVIFYHDVEGFSLMTAAKYKRNNPNTKFFVDTHSDKHNSAKGFISKYILHKMIYHSFFRKSYKYIDKILYISEETKQFLVDMHKITDLEKLEFYPLGGEVLPREMKKKYQTEIRKKLEIPNDNILLVHSGKINELKRTYELLTSFSEVNKDKMNLVIIGTIDNDYYNQIRDLLKQKNVIYLGWLPSSELMKYIAAADLYLQPGSQSAVMQNSICQGTPVCIFDYPSHKYYNKGNAFVIKNYDDIYDVFNRVLREPTILSVMSEKSYELAKHLDYRTLAARITIDNEDGGQT